MYAIYVYIYMVTFTSNILQMLAYIYPHLAEKDSKDINVAAWFQDH